MKKHTAEAECDIGCADLDLENEEVAGDVVIETTYALGQTFLLDGRLLTIKGLGGNGVHSLAYTDGSRKLLREEVLSGLDEVSFEALQDEISDIAVFSGTFPSVENTDERASVTLLRADGNNIEVSIKNRESDRNRFIALIWENRELALSDEVERIADLFGETVRTVATIEDNFEAWWKTNKSA